MNVVAHRWRMAAFGLVTSISISGGVACAPAAPPALPTLRVATVAWAGFSPLDLAAAKGFFEEAGVHVEVVPSEDGTSAAALARGEIDADLDVLGTYVDRAVDGADVQILAELDWSYGGDELIVRPPLANAIDALRSRSRSVGVYSATASNLLLADLFLHDTSRHPDWGLSIGALSVAERTPEELVSAFVAGTDVLSLNYQPLSTSEIDAGGTVVATSATYPGVIAEGLVVNRTRYAQADHSAYRAFFRGWIRAVEYMYGAGHTRADLNAAHAAEVVDIVRRKTYGDDGTTDAEVVAYLRNVRHHSAGTLGLLHSDRRTDVRVAEYNERGAQPLRSHVAEIRAFIQTQRPDAPSIDLTALVNTEDVEAAATEAASVQLQQESR